MALTETRRHSVGSRDRSKTTWIKDGAPHTIGESTALPSGKAVLVALQPRVEQFAAG
jgi:hypothetical protein